MVVNGWVRGGLWSASVVVGAVSGWLDGSGVHALVSVRALTSENVVPHTAPSPSSRATDIVAALEKMDPFDSTLERPRASAVDTTSDTTAITNDEAHPFAAPICPDVQVVAIVAAEDGAGSLAVLRTVAEETSTRPPLASGLRFGERVIRHVGTDRVWLTGRDSLCQALLGETPPRPGATEVVAPTPTRTPSRGGGRIPEEIRKMIEANGVHDFTIDRRARDWVLERTDLAAAGTRIVPLMTDGALRGLRVVSFDDGTLPALLGLAKGDTLHAMNGIAFDSPERGLEALAKFRVLDDVRLEIVRGGSPITLHYTFR
ncbi:MAG: type II secretion system protein GspC [Polyangiaceae bacterium]